MSAVLRVALREREVFRLSDTRPALAARLGDSGPVMRPERPG